MIVPWEIYMFSNKNLSQRHVFHYKVHVGWPRIEQSLPHWEAGDLPPELWHGLQEERIYTYKQLNNYEFKV